MLVAVVPEQQPLPPGDGLHPGTDNLAYVIEVPKEIKESGIVRTVCLEAVGEDSARRSSAASRTSRTGRCRRNTAPGT